VNRLLAVFLVIAPIGLAYSFVVEPLLAAHRGYEESIARSRDLIERYGRIGATHEPLERQLNELRKRAESAGGYLKAKSATLAAAQLQNRVKRIVTQNGGSIQSLQTLPAQNERDLERITIRIQMTAGIEQLQKIIHAFETGRTHLFVDDVNVRVQRARRSRRRGNTLVADERLLSVRLNLYGFSRREES
jgi:general secretion pathway protein M